DAAAAKEFVGSILPFQAIGIASAKGRIVAPSAKDLILATSAKDLIGSAKSRRLRIVGIKRAGENIAQDQIIAAIAKELFLADIAVEHIVVIPTMQLITRQIQFRSQGAGRISKELILPGSAKELLTD